MDNISNGIIVPDNATYNLIDIISKGGILMIPLALLFILAIYIFFNKLFTINNAINKHKVITNTTIQYLKANNIIEIHKLCKNYSNLISKIIQKIALNLGKPIKDLYLIGESVAKVEIAKIEKGLSILSLLAAIAPMVGFIGTVIGIIQIFFNIAQAGEISINIVAGGLYVKLITSAAGLIVGVISYVFYHILDNKLDNLTIQVEEETNNILEVLDHPN